MTAIARFLFETVAKKSTATTINGGLWTRPNVTNCNTFIRLTRSSGKSPRSTNSSKRQSIEPQTARIRFSNYNTRRCASNRKTAYRAFVISFLGVVYDLIRSKLCRPNSSALSVVSMTKNSGASCQDNLTQPHDLRLILVQKLKTCSKNKNNLTKNIQ